MTGALQSVTRALVALGVALYLALGVSVLVRLVDAGLDIQQGAWALFDDSGVGLDDRMVPALWTQWFWLWVAAAFYWPITACVLVLVLRRVDDDVELVPVRAFATTLVPGLATFGLYAVADAAAGVAARKLPSADPRHASGARIASLARAVPTSLAVGGAIAFVTVVVAMNLPPTLAKLVLLAGLMAPLGVPPLLRAWQLVLVLRLLRDLAEREAVDAVRAGHSTSAGA